jgi:hypothetical protein
MRVQTKTEVGSWSKVRPKDPRGYVTPYQSEILPVDEPEVQSDLEMIQAPEQQGKPKKNRPSSRKLEVHRSIKPIWDVFESTPVNISIAQYLKECKPATKDLVDGLRFLNQRQPRQTYGRVKFMTTNTGQRTFRS